MLHRALIPLASLLFLPLVASGCGGSASHDGANSEPAAGVDSGGAGGAAADSAAAAGNAGAAAEAAPSEVTTADSDATEGRVQIDLTEADLDAFERGFAKEIELVKAAKARGGDAKTAAERGKAAQEEWAEQTAPAGAQAAGLSPERYLEIREVVTHALETLDLQGEIEGPMEVDPALASPEMQARLESDAYDGLRAGSVGPFRKHLDRLARLWSEYASLGAMAG